MDTFNIGYPKFWISKNLEKVGFVQVCHLQERLTLWCVIVMVQTMTVCVKWKLKSYMYAFEILYLRYSWPLNFGYLFFLSLYKCKFALVLR